MNKTQLLNARFSFKDGPYNIVYESLHGLFKKKNSIQKLKLSLNMDDVHKSTIEIDGISYTYKKGVAMSILNTENSNIK
jgi:hypothetical protein